MPLVTVRVGDANVEEPIRVVDGNFLAVFRFPLLEGTAADALSRPDSLVVSERLARKHFGAGPAIGRKLNLAIDGERRSYQVSGVLAPMPKRTEIETEMMVRLAPERLDRDTFYNWGSSMLKTFLRFDTPEDAAAFERRWGGA